MEPAFTATVRQTAAGPVVECVGAVDLDGAPLLRAALHEVLAARPVPSLVVVDLAAVTFCDSSGLNVLLKGRTEAGRQGVALHLAHVGRQVGELLRITGVDRLFPVAHDTTAPGARRPAP